MTPGAPTHRTRRHRPVRRWVRRTAQTLGAIVAISGAVSFALLAGLAEVPAILDSDVVGLIGGVALVVFLISLVLGAIWASVVLIRQLMLRIPRRRRLRRMAARIGWEWHPHGKTIPPNARSALDQIRPELASSKRKSRYSEYLRGTFAGRTAVAFHFERGASYELEVEQFVALALPGSLPDVQIIDRGEDPYGVSGQQQFESARFNHFWRVHTDDPRYGSAFTHPQLMELLNSFDVSITEIRLAGSWLISHAPTDFTPELLHLHLGALAKVADAVPAWVWQDYGRRVGPVTGPGRPG